MRDFPNKPIHLATFEAGSGVERVARLIAQAISRPLGQPVIVDNWPGLASVEHVTQAAPDGYTLLHFGPSLWTAPLLQKVSYDPENDLSPITLAVSQPNILVVHPSVEANSVAELIALARARPGELKYASGINGASSQLASQLFTSLGDVDIVGVPYENTAGLAVKDLIAGKVQMMIFSVSSGMRHVRAGHLKALAVTSAQPSALAPDLPTVAATLPEYESVHVQAVFAPAKTPLPSVERLNYEIVRWLRTAEAKDELLKVGIEAVGSTIDALAARGRSETAKWGKLISDLTTGIK